MNEEQQKENVKNEVRLDDIIYSTNKEEKTADVIHCYSKNAEIYIPLSIIYESKEYDVISISKKAFHYSNVKSIKFPSDSKLQTIEEDAFRESALESLTIPSKVTELKEGWCCFTKYLNKIDVDPSNPRYHCYENKMILGKSTIESSQYVNLNFCVRNIETITIPNYIEHINSHAFNQCKKLQHIEFENDSKLQTIDEYSFMGSSIDYIKIPSHVKRIGEGAFQYCYKLYKIELLNDSELQTIEEDAFRESALESLTIPSKVTELKEGWCSFTKYLNKIDVDPSNPRYHCYENKMILGKSTIESSQYVNLNFCVRNIETITIPNYIEHINSHAFNQCNKLQHIEFENESKLQTIDEYSFMGASIDYIKIPSKVTHIKKCAFSSEHLHRIEFPNDSNLQMIEEDAFSHSSIVSITIPSQLTYIGVRAFFCCLQLRRIEIPIDSKLQIIDHYAFANTSIKKIAIPSKLTHIKTGAFDTCKRLKHIEIQYNSKLQTIEDEAFADTSIGSIVIPSNVTKISMKVFILCDRLQIIEFNNEIKLESIDIKWFNFSKSIIFMIPNK